MSGQRRTHLIKRERLPYSDTMAPREVACGTITGMFTKATRVLADVDCQGCRKTLFMADREVREAQERERQGRGKN